MNAYPPPRYVAQGIFRLLPHPIYTGFTMLCVGVSIAVVSASGLWLVSPIVALSCAARVLGYERHDLRERFGRASMSLLPAAGPTSPSASERSACHAFVLLQWVALYKGVVALGKPPDAIHSSDPPGAGMSELFHTSGSLRFSRKPQTRDDPRTHVREQLVAKHQARHQQFHCASQLLACATNRGNCFRLRGNPNVLKTFDSCTVPHSRERGPPG